MYGSVRKSLLLHCCCAPCATHPIMLLRDGFDITIFFYNPNIYPDNEYRLRKREIEHLAEKWGVPIIVGDYDSERWFDSVRGHEQDREGGTRCEICYRIRLEMTAEVAVKEGIEIFTTTLSISPHKKAEIINRIGEEVARRKGIVFMAADFKKKNGFKISCMLSSKEGLYRQKYCGCKYSMRKDT